MARNDDGEPAVDALPAERILLFRLDARLHAIRVDDIGGVLCCENLRELPGAPAGVLGLGDWRGSVITVLDLPRYLGPPERDAPACLIRLAPPLEQTALYLPATVQLTENPLERPSEVPSGEAEPCWFCGGEAVVLVDPLEIVRRVESEMSESN